VQEFEAILNPNTVFDQKFLYQCVVLVHVLQKFAVVTLLQLTILVLLVPIVDLQGNQDTDHHQYDFTHSITDITPEFATTEEGAPYFSK
jgi:hypothetical protein